MKDFNATPAVQKNSPHSLNFMAGILPIDRSQVPMEIIAGVTLAALALKIEQAGYTNITTGEVYWTLQHVPAEVRAIPLQMPTRQAGKSRLDRLLYELDAGIRGKPMP